MRFRIGPWTYRVRIAPAPLRDAKRRRRAGLVVWATHEIMLCPTVPPPQRIDHLLHELRHVWRRHHGVPLDAEGDCNAASTFFVSIRDQLDRQGGNRAIERLQPDGTIDAGAVTDAAAVQVGAQCRCQTKFSPAQIVTEPPCFDPKWAMMTVRRSVFCDYCTAVMQWTESSTTGGMPSGRVLGEPEFLTGPAMDQFLRLHGEKAGVLVSE